MRSMWQTWVIFGVCLALVLGAMAWVSRTVTGLDERDLEARKRAVLEENARLILWRQDAQVVNWLHYADRELPMGAAAPGYVKVRFVLSPTAGVVITPDAQGLRLTADERERLLTTLTPPRLTEIVTRARPPEIPAPTPIIPATTTEPPEEQALRGYTEWRARQRFAQRNLGRDSISVWLGGQLLWLHRGAERGTWRGVVLDWARLRTELQVSACDLLPEATMVPAPDGDDAPRYHLLATLPVCLVPGELGFYYQPQLTPTRLMLMIAWSCMLLPAVGLGILLLAMATLSERRASFVSSVTHELRTPLATLRMYTDMLAGGMVPAERQPQYLQTLQREAARLSYLVDNVLTYARIERGKTSEALAVIGAAELLDRVSEQLKERATRASMDLNLEVTTAAEGMLVQADPAAVERILINLVDNACKYGFTDKTHRIDVTVELEPPGENVLYRVRDYGHGLPVKESKRLFRPFSRLDQAHAQAGLGLGLALSRKLARRMKGDLWLAPGTTEGAEFILRLPAAAEPV